MPRYLRAIQVPSGALISTQISIMIFFLSGGSGCQWHQHIEEASNILVLGKWFKDVTCGPSVGTQELSWCRWSHELCTLLHSQRGHQFWEKLFWIQIFKYKCKVRVLSNTGYLFTISPWFSTRTAMSMNISCSSLMEDSSFTNISCLGSA